MLYMKSPLMRRYDTEVIQEPGMTCVDLYAQSVRIRQIGDLPSLYHDKVKDILRELEEALLSEEVNAAFKLFKVECIVIVEC